MNEIREAIAYAFKERWPQIKITDEVENYYGEPDPKTTNSSNRINVELPSKHVPGVALRVASVDLNGDEIEASFYGASSYSHNLYHPESLTELEELLAGHIAEVESIAKDVSL